MTRVLVVIVLLFLFIPGILSFSQDGQGGTTGQDTPQTQPADEKQPEAYTEGEFPGWTLGLRRGEIIFFGSLPLTLLVTFFSYDIIRWGVSGWSGTYQPFGNVSVKPYSTGEIVGVFLFAAGLSLAISITDAVIHNRKMSHPEKG